MIKTFERAFIGVPKHLTKSGKNIYCQLDELDFKDLLFGKEKVSVVFYVSGSAGFTKGESYRKWVIQNTQSIFFSPNTFEIQNRPTYNAQSSLEEYEVVHATRLREIEYNVEQLKKFAWVDEKRILLMGNSEGATASGIYEGEEFFARILLAWNCEAGYYLSDASIGAKIDTPILAIIGREDEYFSKESEPNRGYDITGNCVEALRDYHNAKNIVYSNMKHNLLNENVKNDVVSFINQQTLK